MNEPLTLEQEACNADTSEHIRQVAVRLHRMARKLLDRADRHDQSKLASPEVELFTEYTPKLAAVTFGSPEYEAMRKSMGPALGHHYANNRHHPEHHKNGVEDMTLLDVLEMLCDWDASSKRHHDGNIRRSIEKNADRFGIVPQLRRILENSVDEISDG